MLTIIIPTFNEEERIERSINQVHSYVSEHSITHEILVVDNGSTDSTVEQCKKIEKKTDWFRVYSLPEKGPGRAFCKGVRESRGDAIITLDADLSSSLDFIPEACRLLKNYSAVIGSKSMGEQRRTIVRVFGSYSYISVAQFLFDMSITDYSIGCKAFKKEILISLLDHLDYWTGHIFEICLFCKIHSIPIIEVGVECEDKNLSRFNLGHEALYRFRHLFKTKSEIKRNSFLLNASPQINRNRE